MNQYTSKKLGYNIVYSVLQIFVSVLVVFFLYRYAIHEIGIGLFGVWSVVSTSITSLAILNYGFSGSLVKYIAKYQSVGDSNKVKKLIETSTISITLFAIIIGMTGYWLFTSYIHVLIDNQEHILLSKQLIKICTVTFCVTVVSNIFQSALEGLNYITTKSLINCVVSIILLISSFFLVRSYGVIGLGYGYLISNFAGMLIASTALWRKFPHLKLTTWRWDVHVFKETFRYNYNFQIISVFSLLNDPITKLILTKFGGTEYTGLYELASKLVLQARNVLATANQALVPMFANLQETDPGRIKNYFKKSFFYVFILSTFLFFSVVAFAPVFSLWLIGSIHHVFIFLLDITAVSWYINSITMPAYFANLGSGNMVWNTRSHVGMGLSNASLSLLLAVIAPPIFICVGWLFSLAVFSLLIIFFYLKENKISEGEIMPSKNWVYLGVAISLSVSLTFCFLQLSSDVSPVIFIASSFLYLAIHLYFLFYKLVGKDNKLHFIRLITN